MGVKLAIFILSLSDKKSVIYLQESVIAKEDLIKKITALLKEKPKLQILIRGDKETSYGDIIQVFGMLKQASINNVTLLTEEQ